MEILSTELVVQRVGGSYLCDTVIGSSSLYLLQEMEGQTAAKFKVFICKRVL